MFMCPVCTEEYLFAAIKQCGRCKSTLIDSNDSTAMETWEKKISQEIYQLEIEMGLHPQARHQASLSPKKVWIGTASLMVMIILSSVALLVF